jgi:hypothetical protein
MNRRLSLGAVTAGTLERSMLDAGAPLGRSRRCASATPVLQTTPESSGDATCNTTPQPVDCTPSLSRNPSRDVASVRADVAGRDVETLRRVTTSV